MSRKNRRHRSGSQFITADDLSVRMRKAKSFNDCVKVLLAPQAEYLQKVDLAAVDQDELQVYRSCSDKAKQSLLNVIGSRGFLSELNGFEMQILAYFNEIICFAREADACFAAGRALNSDQIMKLILLDCIIRGFISSTLIHKYNVHLSKAGLMEKEQPPVIDPDGMMQCQQDIAQSIYKALYERKDSGLVVEDAEAELRALCSQLMLLHVQTIDAFYQKVARGEVSYKEMARQEFFKGYLWPAFHACFPMGELLAKEFGLSEQRSGRSLRAAPPGTAPLNVFL